MARMVREGAFKCIRVERSRDGTLVIIAEAHPIVYKCKTP